MLRVTQSMFYSETKAFLSTTARNSNENQFQDTVLKSKYTEKNIRTQEKLNQTEYFPRHGIL